MKTRNLSGSDRRERTVRSVLKGHSVLFYHYRFGPPDGVTDRAAMLHVGRVQRTQYGIPSSHVRV